MISVRLPRCTRDWALPVLMALYVAPPKPAADATTTNTTNNNKSKSKKNKKHRLTPELRKRDESGKLPPRHKTPALLARQMTATLLHWFPDRRVVLLGDWGFASHDLALFCHRHRSRLTLVARTRSDMNLHALPPARRPPGRRGCPPRKGAKLPTPDGREAVDIASCRLNEFINQGW